MASPLYFPEGHTGLPQDTQLRLLQKILGSLNDGGGSGGGTPCVNTSETVPVVAPDVASCPCSVVFGIGAIAGAVYVWDTTTNAWFPVISGP